MELELGKWLLDVAKYMLTALILANFFWRYGFTKCACISNSRNGDIVWSGVGVGL